MVRHREYKVVRYFDMDDTLCYPSPFKQLKGEFKNQNMEAKTDGFRLKLVNCPKAPWLTESMIDALFTTGTNVVLTGRHSYHDIETEIWLKKNGIKVKRIVYLSFRDYQLYLQDKKDYIEASIRHYKPDQVEFYEDNQDLCDWAVE